MKVRAVSRGYQNNRTRYPGEIFECPERDLALVGHAPGGWMEPVHQHEIAALLQSRTLAKARRRKAIADATVEAIEGALSAALHERAAATDVLAALSREPVA
jgi:hypothetical protein